MGIYDIDGFGGDMFSNPRRPRPTLDYNQKATPEETESMGSKLFRMTGLPYIASSLDKPGRAVRGYLGGRPNEIKNLIPFSDTLGITDPKDEVTGADLNKKYLGVKNDNSWTSFGAGLGTEMLLDPTNLVTLGAKHALTAAGKTARAAGRTKGLTRTQMLGGFDHSMDALKAANVPLDAITQMQRQGRLIAPAGSGIQAGVPLSGLARVGIPFTDIGFNIGTGKTARSMAGMLDKAGEKVNRLPGMPTLNSWFSPDVARALSPEMQTGMRKYGAPLKEASDTVARRQDLDVIKQTNDLISQGAWNGLWNERDALHALLMRAENVSPSGVLPVHPDLWNAVQPLGSQLNQAGKDMQGHAQAQGVKQGKMVDQFGTEYFFRRPTKAAKRTAGVQAKGPTLVPSGHGSMVSRQKWSTNVPGGTAMINKWSMDPALSGANRTLNKQQVKAAVLQDMVGHLQGQGIPVTQDMLKGVKKAKGVQEVIGLEDKAAQVARKLGRIGPEYAAQQIPFYNQNVAKSMAIRTNRQNRVVNAARTFYQTLGDIAQPTAALGPDAIPLNKLASRVGFTTTEGGAHGLQGSLVEIHKALARKGLPFTEDVLGQAPAVAKKKLLNAARSFAVTPRQAADILRKDGAWKAPAEVSAPIKVLDSFTHAFRKGAYSFWPSSHVRNATGGVVQAAIQTGTGPSAYANAAKVLNGTATAAEVAAMHPGMPAALSDEAAREWVKGEAHAHANIFGGINQEPDLLGGMNPTGKITPDDLTAGNITLGSTLGEAAQGAYQTAKDVAATVKNPKAWLNPFAPGRPFEMQGVGQGTRDFPYMAAMQNVGGNIEKQLRLAQYLGQTAKGVSPVQAGRDVFKTHFDYSNLTPFEQNVMRRVFPFYTYMSRNLPLQLETMLHTPGKTSSQLRLATGGNTADFVPSQISNGVAIPTGPEDENGNRQFISQLGIPIEEAFERAKFNPADPLGSIKNTAMAYAGGMNPLIKGPLEWLFDKQFFTGRNLSDLRPQGTIGSLGQFLDEDNHYPGMTQLAAQVAANTPASRFFTTIDKLADPRKSALAKAANLLTGVRVTDVDMEKSRAIEARKALEAVLRSNPLISKHTDFYVKPEDRLQLSPEDIKNLQVLARMKQDAKDAAKRNDAMRPRSAP